MAEPEHELDPSIWSNTPYDILLNIIKYSDIPTQINWSCTSRALYPVASSNIWGSLRLLGSEIEAYVFIVSGQWSTDRAYGIVHFLLESAYRGQLHAWNHVFANDRTCGTFVHRSHGIERYSDYQQLVVTLPTSHVKDLEIDNQGFDVQHPICPQFDMDLVLSTLLRRLPRLQSFGFMGPLSANALAAIIQVDHLRVLQVRNGSDVLTPLIVPNPVFTVPWLDFALNWSTLANLQRLEVLELGRLISHEAGELAQGVASLNLRKLKISCWGWEYENTDPSNSVPSNHLSPLVDFLDAITTLDLDVDHACRGFPSTLEDLVLIDKHRTQIPSLHQLIATAILPCEHLKSLSTKISVNGSCYEIINKMGLPAYHKTVGLHSWQQFSSDEDMRILHQYQSPSGEKLHTNPCPRPLRNIANTLDQVITTAEGPGNYRMSMKFVRQRQRSDEIIVFPCEGEDPPSAHEQGPQAHDARMGLAADFKSLSLEGNLWAHMLQFWGIWPDL